VLEHQSVRVVGTISKGTRVCVSLLTLRSSLRGTDDKLLYLGNTVLETIKKKNIYIGDIYIYSSVGWFFYNHIETRAEQRL